MRIGKQVLIKLSSIEKNVATVIKGMGSGADLILLTVNGVALMKPWKKQKTLPLPSKVYQSESIADVVFNSHSSPPAEWRDMVENLRSASSMGLLEKK